MLHLPGCHPLVCCILPVECHCVAGTRHQVKQERVDQEVTVAIHHWQWPATAGELQLMLRDAGLLQHLQAKWWLTSQHTGETSTRQLQAALWLCTARMAWPLCRPSKR